ncbi:hypothetical protein [Lederbergia galactosidilytica]|uniref:Uncharacterized protein n=1 Tax=Lederbergia galactosidilytica TaxID=217031 RepID=A0A0Q9XM02_9BACI|nr:hypothetical protein [Lederbergia galactosidilytica]KRG09388.1 hypothetical protein ACA29_23425 [Lederbergia galactosidilytica]KRG16076.1 hypothetical protein ACA30_03145 [Virgibacillus soli]MBP1915280.1 hypothetical protein [Lederbergia galactosidilytica]OAK68109.1 hypothetical protein ABB05_16215 [Lederbergia galactosidilytica]
MSFRQQMPMPFSNQMPFPGQVMPQLQGDMSQQPMYGEFSQQDDMQAKHFFPGTPNQSSLNRRVDQLENQVRRLERQFNRLERRVSRLEGQGSYPGFPGHQGRPEYDETGYY